ncbi:MAG: 1-phosphofructokinase [Clostridia bacterium]|nr:1-phosphofructokinase [Clostridia bacterium]
MIYTLTLNPAIDYVVKTNNFKTGMLNRASGEAMYAGGKGINVSRVLKSLGIDSVALGFVAGFTGGAVRAAVEACGIETDFVMLNEGNTRINIKMKDICETELNGKGPFIQEVDKNRLFDKLAILKNGDILVMSGSNAYGLTSDIYREIMQNLKDREIKFAVDASGELLKNTLPLRPWFIKPNKDEVEHLFGVEIKSTKDAADCAKKLCLEGAKNAFVSLGADGAVCACESGDIYKVSAPKGEALNTVGAGDSAVAGFLAGYNLNGDINEALRLAVAAGSATAFSEDLASGENIMDSVDMVKVEML